MELELPGTAHHELVVYHVVEDSPVARGERIPRWARPSLVVRKRPVDATAICRPHPGRRSPLSLHGAAQHPAARPPVRQPRAGRGGRQGFLRRVLHRHQPAAWASWPRPMASSRRAIPPMPIGNYMLERLGGQAEVGDRVADRLPGADRSRHRRERQHRRGRAGARAGAGARPLDLAGLRRLRGSCVDRAQPPRRLGGGRRPAPRARASASAGRGRRRGSSSPRSTGLSGTGTGPARRPAT